MNKRVMVLGIGALTIMAVSVWWFLWRGTDQQETAIVERGSIDVTIQTVGTIQAVDAIHIRSTMGGSIAALGVKPGDVVKEGDIIVLLDPEPVDARIEQAERQLEQAEYALQLAESIREDETENASLRLEAVNAAQRVDAAAEQLELARDARSLTAILAPRDGTILEVSVGESGIISEQQQVATLAALDDLALVADVDELDLLNVQPGAPVTFRLDAVPATELDGVVENTAPQARTQGGATVFPTRISFVYSGKLDVRPGMNADVTIVTDEREDVLLIPEQALRTVGDRAFVLVDSGDETEEREVLLGYRGQGRVEIVDGLAEGDVVVIP